ncbi:transferase family protein [Hypoxylon rubiginosum]|uniref:Transferase family protein n=1 Tax=Hypoxylon rubiginosum TaxID=110542 RepID=A0ACB9YUE3_9PEZI|nr:transferase family protein [Hypoxylon rubiginosum]
MAEPLPVCRVRYTRRVFPANAPQQKIITKLSILDGTVARYAPCSAIWLYDRAEKADAHDPLLFERLEEALKRTLDDYPHFSGQLRWASKDLVQGDVNPNYLGRLIVVYGAGEGPGVELVVAEDSRELGAVVPNHEERSTVKQVWIATNFPQDELQPNTQLAFSRLSEFEGLPGAAVQLTAFKCGGFAVSIKLTHCLSDAMCLMQFAHTWAAHSRLLFGDDSPDITRVINEKPLFDPSQLEQHANLTAGASKPNVELINKARSLPVHRYDWWAADAPGFPSWAPAANNGTIPPAEELAGLELSHATLPPWPTWDMAAPVEHVQIRFKAETIAKMKRAAEASLPVSLSGQRVSRLDAALAHIWILINRARQHENTQRQVYLDVTLGLRSRVEPPLPDTFTGSPLLLAHVAKAGSEASAATIGAIAGSIRETMSRFTPDAVSAFIHDAAFETSPQRLWQAFLGSQHCLVTSWVRARAYEVDFCAIQRPALYVQGVMPRLDGLVQVMDIAETGDFDIGVYLEKESMQRFLQDPMLRAYGL